MTKAEQAALEAFPVKMVNVPIGYEGSVFDFNALCRYIFQEGYEQAEKDLGWHSVDESLPPMDEEVIVLTDEFGNAPVYEIAVGHTVDKNKVTDFDGWNIPGVKFWMPMPEIPKEEKK